MNLSLGLGLPFHRPSGATDSGFPMDAYTADAKTFVSTRRLLTSFVGDPIRMRDAAANEADIAFAADWLDVDATERAALLGSGNGFAVRMYEQSGSGSANLAQATAGSQPYTQLGSTVLANGRQAVAGGNFPTGSGSRVLFGNTTAPGTGDFFLSFLFKKGGSSASLQGLGAFGFFAPAFYSRYTNHIPTIYLGAQKAFNTTLVAGNVYVVAFARESGTLKCWVNGVQEATTYADSTNITGALSMCAESFGGGATTSDSIQEMLYYNSAKAADRAAIMANQMTHGGL